MAWVETVAPSFRARHEARDAKDAERLLNGLEALRDDLARVFPRALADVTVVLHPSGLSLAFTNPLVPVARLATAPSARRYVGGWAGFDELHVLSPAALRERASKVAGSSQMLERTAAALYTRRVITENNRELADRLTPARALKELRWAWLLEGGARWFAGQTAHARPAIARRLHEGRRPSFPPGFRDAPLLGGTVIDLLAREQGVPAAAQFVCRLHPQGARAALAKAFGGRALYDTEGVWRSHLAKMAGA